VGGRGLDTFFYTCRPPTRTTQRKRIKKKNVLFQQTGVVAGGVVIRGARERTGKNDTHITIIEREREKRIIFKEKKKMMIINK
jgi:hypothetical protein